MATERHIDRVVESIKSAEGCTLLIGAGCSFTGEIPLASGFVKDIKENYSEACKYLSEKDKNSYAACMAKLSRGERRNLITKYIDKSKINWAHLAIAQLMKAGHVDRILTTNFDNLAVKACSLIGLYPAVYDFAVSQIYKPADIPSGSIFHLHGQSTGFVQLHTEEEVNSHEKTLAPVFQDAGLKRVWIVVGYSGDNDPVFENLVKIKQFDY